MNVRAGTSTVGRRLRLWLVPGLLVAAGTPQGALAHAGEAPTPDTLWSTWTWDPLVMLLLMSVTLGYLRGTRRIWKRTGRGQGVRTSQLIAFVAALVVLVVAVISPLDALGEALFSAHMIQHLLLMLIAAPLMVYARPWLPVLWSLPREWRVSAGRRFRNGTPLRRILDVLTTPLAAWLLNLVVLWIWHIPFFYDAAVESWLVHLVEHASFVGAAMVFWWTILPLARQAGTARHGLAVLSLFTTALHSGLLAAILTFSRAAWYVSHAGATEAWGLSPLQDQQLAGVIMWVPMGLIYTVTAAVVLILLLQRLGEDDTELATPTTGERATEAP